MLSWLELHIVIVEVTRILELKIRLHRLADLGNDCQRQAHLKRS